MPLKIGDLVHVFEPGRAEYTGRVIGRSKAARPDNPIVLVEDLIPARIPIPDRVMRLWVHEKNCALIVE